MDISVIRTIPVTNNDSYSTNPQVPRTENSALDRTIDANKSEADKTHAQAEDQSKQELTHDELDTLTEHLNKFMKAMNTDLHFELHDETKRMMVRFIDPKDGKVIKEFPPRELLDTLAAIKDYVGFLLDKKV